VPISLSLAAAAGVAFAVFVARPPAVAPAAPEAMAASPLPAGPRVLEDGSIIELNLGAVVSVDYLPTERRVWMQAGEAHFTVAKDPGRPFIVNARGVDVRAVGTAFNVRVDAEVVEVLVTEGRVQVDSTPEAAPVSTGVREVIEPPLIPLLAARQRAIVSVLPTPRLPEIATLTLGEIERVLAWQHRLLEFTAAPLAEIVAEFNRRNVLQLVLMEPEIAATRVSGSFRSDNVEGFVNLLQGGFGVRSERRGETEILLWKVSR
jgi:transmembrane sensor